MFKSVIEKMADAFRTMFALICYNITYKTNYPRYPKKTIKKMIDSAPGMTFKSEKVRNKFLEFKDLNSGDFGESIIEFAESWARLAEAEKAKGRIMTPGLILECGMVADRLYGNSGWSFATAKNILFTYWKYGYRVFLIRN